MKLLNPLFLGLPLLAVAVACVPASAAPAFGNPTLELHYGADGASTCTFLAQDGIVLKGEDPGTWTATGSFGAGCPTGGGNTGQAQVDFLTVPPASANVNDTVTVKWRATADICTYGGTSLPAPLPNWPASGNACIGAYACAQAHSVSPVLSVGGTYTFGLTCTSGANATGQPESTIAKVASVTVTGAPPPASCVAPAGLTRQTLGTISLSSGANTRNNVDMTQWLAVFGTNMFNPSQTMGWPGFDANDIKFNLKKNQYFALKFTVGPNYPFYNGTTQFPFGGFSTNPTNVDMVNWTLSITPACGDFAQPQVGDPDYANAVCYQQYNMSSSNNLTWIVEPDGVNNPGACTLHRNETYYLNMVTANLATPTQSTCNRASCRANFKSNGAFSGTQGK